MSGKEFLGNMTENLQADFVQSRQAGFVPHCLFNAANFCRRLPVLLPHTENHRGSPVCGETESTMSKQNQSQNRQQQQSQNRQNQQAQQKQNQSAQNCRNQQGGDDDDCGCGCGR